MERETVPEIVTLREARGDADTLGDFERVVDTDGQADDDRLVIGEREMEAQPLELKEAAALRDVVGVEFELCDRRGDNDSLGETEDEADADGQRDDVGLAIEVRETEEQPLELTDTAALLDDEAETDEFNEV